MLPVESHRWLMLEQWNTLSKLVALLLNLLKLISFHRRSTNLLTSTRNTLLPPPQTHPCSQTVTLADLALVTRRYTTWSPISGTLPLVHWNPASATRRGQHMADRPVPCLILIDVRFSRLHKFRITTHGVALCQLHPISNVVVSK